MRGRNGAVELFVFKSLEGKRVKLIPLDAEHATALFEAAKDKRIWTQYPTKITTMQDMQNYIRKAIEGRDRHEQYPFAVFDQERNKFVGSTRFLRISPENNNLNIGSTWFAPEVWRTRVNTESKYLMLSYAFDVLAVNRVEIITTTENLKSQQAIERLGAVREGILRKKYHNLDYVVYSILFTEWTDVKQRLEWFLGG